MRRTCAGVYRVLRGFMAVAKKMNPKLVQGFSDLFGLYMKDGASETVAAATNTVVAAMSGDWASAVASASFFAPGSIFWVAETTVF